MCVWECVRDYLIFLNRFTVCVQLTMVIGFGPPKKDSETTTFRGTLMPPASTDTPCLVSDYRRAINNGHPKLPLSTQENQPWPTCLIMCLNELCWLNNAFECFLFDYWHVFVMCVGSPLVAVIWIGSHVCVSIYRIVDHCFVFMACDCFLCFWCVQ